MSVDGEADILPPDVRRRASSLQFVRALLPDVPVIVSICLFAAAAAMGNLLFGIPRQIFWTQSFGIFARFALLYIVVANVVVLCYILVVRNRSLYDPETWRALTSTLWSPRRTLSFGVVYAGIAILMPTFVAFKQAIPILQPFSWDPVLMEWDRWLHLGRHPFEWLQPLVGHPRIIKALDTTYLLWLYVMLTTVIWQAWHGSRDDSTRSQFLLSFILSWIFVGTVMAIMMSSAGPVYFTDVTGLPDPYAALSNHLEAVDRHYKLRAIALHDLLWTAYVSPESGIIAGISAMPSMHVAIVVLQTFLGFRVNRILGWAYATFAFLIFLGSVQLAWHYAVDAYVALLAAAALWLLSGRMVRWWSRTLRIPD